MPKAPLRKGLGSSLGEIPVEFVQLDDPTVSTAKKDYSTLTSYNLLPKRERSMIVPGTPSIWKLAPACKVKPDSGKYIQDPNTLVFPKCSLEPLFRAIAVTKPTMNLNDIDLISDRRNLRLLLALVSGNKKPFRINIEVVASTVLFTTYANSKVNFVQNFEGYGREYEKASTWTPRHVRGSITHNRVVRYTLGGVRIMLRFEVDACMPAKPCNMPESSSMKTPSGLTVVKAGRLVGPSRIVEIKTGPARKALDVSKNLSQMWFSQTPILCMGQYTEDGAFLPARQMNAEREGKLRLWEKNNEDKIRRLIRVLQMIMELVKRGPPICALIHEGDGVLRVYQDMNMGKRGIPVDLLPMWTITPKTTETHK
ncbi:hypothetical protein ETB97_009027 [Aspergillus alliaceus]|uniref:Uncharacterized protein n=2 Tax=Petromyces alliaceus TaxID=209559 RepID=A0A8H6ABC9_PETAA|nr:hypothetical protein ETB97_009027 [Aspergillus burnettii]